MNTDTTLSLHYINPQKFANYINTKDMIQYTKLMTSPNIDKGNTIFGILFTQLLISSIVLLTVIWVYDTNITIGTYHRVILAEFFFGLWETEWFKLFIYIGIALSITIFYLSHVFISKWTIGITLFMSSLYMIIVSFILVWFLALASDAICDPIVRVSQSTEHLRKDPSSFDLIPHSLIDDMEMLSLPQDTNPAQNGICVAHTEYTMRGQRLVTVAVSSTLLSYVCVFVAFNLANQYKDTRNIVFANASIVVLISICTQIVFNEEKWDWRFFHSMSFPILISAFCSVTTLSSLQSDESNLLVLLTSIYLRVMNTIKGSIISILYIS
jgi:hypothetical protein